MNKYSRIILDALKEDAARNDITTIAAIPSSATVTAELVAKENGILCGMDVLKAVFCEIDRRCAVKTFVKDGGSLRAGQIIAKISGSARAILSAERTALNFIQHLSGISTLTGIFVERVKGTKARILDTRKTTPGLRELEKYAVKCGGGYNHRHNLAQMAMIKDNHLRIIKDLSKVVASIRKKNKKIAIEVECQSLSDVPKALDAGADIIMFDNMSRKMISKAIGIINKRGGRKPLTEISGGVNLSNVKDYATLGVDRISVGALTHSAPSLDISLEIVSMEG
ncbi:MAG TPA: carboxylating nicotinate-nucleotide diphosphorylase [Elusimicrobia bacterium]|nr:MAG: nicotinate-nucleotide diphosphorylase (carboxylating) [Elusimicrobia bacterium RIFOXYA12_FULL_49_49]OGS15622.1 MAG: nicotinate-nucleotide diphosphorylase (carboxylating) [Elusimicrobia bacterium RIFOXYA2_FULL_47_53]OGS26822.1 MAG: nicotinate-nucleotide diphosphorylase (carboxylating) [Elusimicrobia bacterium RIFOXYB12_FULL_50_12]OGS30721.1 MAG: nicotinate-nucleotide diphosphorylase (carboxylating) [Elusimicrobia bacterium RIFOXYB2_FULL_46_23]HBU68918.1 carboxylating nicotinate-nucleotid